MNAVIIDDDDTSCELLAQFIARSGMLELAGVFKTPAEALAFLAANRADVVFLDIELPGMNGLELVSAIADPDQKVILVTGHGEFALEAFELHVADYLLKPISYSRFLRSVIAVVGDKRGRILEQVDDDIVFIKKDKIMIRLRKSDVLCAEARGDYVIIHTAKENHVVHCTLKALEEKLPSRAYLRVHRSWLVRINAIEKIEDQTIFCLQRPIPIGRSYREEVFTKIHSL
ncbi:MAG TPA: LytTR family DNA-binding domain-containing protein [Bacteroidia bacterium]|jgi:DNA-binding LytR/AlgR family response regulator|nr:LytTR family DNA-binding domain-containing protein [Bacteroidia bacterium]